MVPLRTEAGGSAVHPALLALSRSARLANAVRRKTPNILPLSRHAERSARQRGHLCVEFLGEVLLEHLQTPDSFDNFTTCF